MASLCVPNMTDRISAEPPQQQQQQQQQQNFSKTLIEGGKKY